MPASIADDTTTIAASADSSMTLDLFLSILQAHLVALRSPLWPHPHDASHGPAMFLDAEDTTALLAELTRIQEQLQRKT
jgi:hypothetical protein